MRAQDVQTGRYNDVSARAAASGGAEAAITPQLLIVLIVILLSGALFGYDQGVISGALVTIKSEFGLTALLIEVVTSWVTLGALIGALLGGELADRLGRRRAIIIAGLVFSIGSLFEAVAPNVFTLVIGRLITGLGVGIAAVSAPLYASELAPATWRGRFISAYQLAVTAGIFLAYLVAGRIYGAEAWRWMLGLSGAPGVMLTLVGIIAPESPRWLMRKGRDGEAAVEMRKIYPDHDPSAPIAAMAATLAHDPGEASWAVVFSKRWRQPLLIGIGLAVFQQITGINAIIYYADQIFEKAGFATADAQTTATTWAIGAVNVAATFIAIAFIDRLGRRTLLVCGLLGMALSLAVVGSAFYFMAGTHPVTADIAPTSEGYVALGALVVFITCFAFSMGPVVWTLINEIFPGNIRGRAVAVATAFNWGSAFLVSQIFLSLIEALGNAATFWLLALFCVLGWIWTIYSVPETKNRSLEQIQLLWEDKHG